MQNKVKSVLLIIMILAVLLTGYSNCSPGFKTAEQDSSILSSLNSVSTESGLCEESLMNLFKSGYYQFLRTNCITCHATDSDKPQFASPDISWAYKVFNEKGYSKISSNAISSGHNPPYSGPQHTQRINELKLEWQQGLQEYSACQGSTVQTNQTEDLADKLTLQTQQKNMPELAVDQTSKVTWDLNSEVTKLSDAGVIPTLPSARLSIQVTRHKTAGGEDYYVFTKPTIFNSIVDIKIKNIYIKINGRLLKYPTTFKFVDITIRQGSLEDASGLISTGGLTAPGSISSQDTLSLAFETLAATNLPAPTPPVSVNFAGSPVRFVDSATGSLDFNIELSRISADPLTITIESDSTALCGSTSSASLVAVSTSCLPEIYKALCDRGLCDNTNSKIGLARSQLGVSYYRYDWDYSMKVDPITFTGSQVSSQFSVKFSKDIRQEENRILKLKINIASSGAKVGTQSTVYIVILKANNPTPASGEITFSKLMNSKGILNLNCVKCHNSKDLQGGYDMTNYELMLSKGILIPGSSQSKMFKRMNANDPSNVNLTPMPLDGFMTDDKIDAVSQWIMNGAKNN